MRFRGPVAVGASIVVGLLVGTLVVVRLRGGRANDGPPVEPLSGAAARIAPLHARKSPPKRGEWLAEHKEAGQTFAQYRRSDPNRPTAERTTVYIQPLGEFTASQAKLVDETADLLSRFYGLPVKKLEPLGLDVIPAKARREHPTWGGKQILSTYVLDDVLRPMRPADSVAVIAFTPSDLWPGEGWNFVFGQASLRERVGVWSFNRFGDPEQEKDYPTVLRRTLQTAAHETGHMLGISHCTAYECGMNGSNHLAEADSRPMDFCPECVQKVWWACGVDPVKRYESLAAFAEAHGLAAEAKFWQESGGLLRDYDRSGDRRK